MYSRSICSQILQQFVAVSMRKNRYNFRVNHISSFRDSLFFARRALSLSSSSSMSNNNNNNDHDHDHDKRETKEQQIISDELRLRARQRIAELEQQQPQMISPNSPLGIMHRSPGIDPNQSVNSNDNATTEAVDANHNAARDNSHHHDAAFAPFPNNVNPITGEVRGPTGPEPTRYGDWERKGRCSDF